MSFYVWTVTILATLVTSSATFRPPSPIRFKDLTNECFNHARRGKSGEFCHAGVNEIHKGLESKMEPCMEMYGRDWGATL